MSLLVDVFSEIEMERKERALFMRWWRKQKPGSRAGMPMAWEAWKMRSKYARIDGQIEKVRL